MYSSNEEESLEAIKLTGPYALSQHVVLRPN
jgi:hypothetical protein